MAKLHSFTFISLNGFYKGPAGDIQWHQHGGEEATYSAESLQAGNTLLFGRVTYDLMKSYWPTQQAYDLYPDVAEAMHKAEKMVVSGSLSTADWHNTSIIQDNLIGRIQQLKQEKQKDITLLGSGSVLKQLSEANLIDEYQIMIDPVFISSGKPILGNLHQNIRLKLTRSQVFRSGAVLLVYTPAEA